MLEYNYSNELYHYGIKGMKWGHRKARPIDPRAQNVRDARSAYKQAKRDYNKSYNSAYNYSTIHPISQFVGKKAKAESTKRWEDVYDKSHNMNKAKLDYKQAKQDRYTPEERAARRQKAIKTGSAIAGTALAAYGAKKLSDNLKDKAFKKAYDKGADHAAKLLRGMSATPGYNDLERKLYDVAIKGAESASKNTIRAIRTLRGK